MLLPDSCFAVLCAQLSGNMHMRHGAHAVARIALVKPDKARGVENLVLQMAQRGQITEKVGDRFQNCCRNAPSCFHSCTEGACCPCRSPKKGS